MNQFDESVILARKLAIKRRIILFTTVFFIFFLVFAFVISSRGISIRISPYEARDQADIIISEGLAFNFGNKIYSASNRIGVIIKAQGYKIYQNNFPVSFYPETVEIILEEIPGSLQIIVTPHHPDTTIHLNKLRLKNLPIISKSDLIGEYDLSVNNALYLPHKETIEIKKGEEKEINIDLKAAEVSLMVTTNPPEAEFFVNEKKIGTTPRNINLKSGIHKIRIKKDGYIELNKKLILKAKNLEKKVEYQLKPLPGELLINVVPDDSDIFIDNIFQEKGSIEKFLSPGNHNFTISKIGYKTVNQTIIINSQDTLDLNFSLNEILGDVSFHSEPPSEILIDGVSFGFTPQILTLRAVEKEVKIQKKGYRSYVSKIMPNPDFVNKVSVILKTEQQARLEEAPKIFQTSLGATMKLFVPGRITLGAPRSDPGQRANEVIRNVLLTKPFYISFAVVTNEQYSNFKKGKTGKDQEPITSISWSDAVLFCNWLSQKENLQEVYLFKNGLYIGINTKANGYRLPTESEWVWAVRYANQFTQDRFSWGNKMPVREDVGNLAGEEVKKEKMNFIKRYKDNYKKLSPVMSFRSVKSGLFDITGNVHEWMHDYYELVDFKPSSELEKDRLGPLRGSGHVVRGSSWRSSSLTELRLTYRSKGVEGEDDIGFRLARWLGE